MTNTYTIYLVNKSADTQNFWCFLAPPDALANDPGVYANSSASLAVVPNSPGINSFTIPVQYVVGAGASNQAVGLDVEIVSTVTNPASLLDTWDANYATYPPNQGPSMLKSSTQAPANSIAIVSNGFDKVTNEINHWFSNQSFGIESESGFIGMSWSPEPQQTRTVTPKLTFYVATGNYGSNALANWDDVSNNAALVEVPGDFTLNECTVTYTESGGWTVTGGKPQAIALAQDLEYLRSSAHQELVALAYLDSGVVATDVVESVAWDNPPADADVESTFLSGTLTVTTALTAAFTYFVLSGFQFNIARAQSGVTTFRFSYSGPSAAKAAKDLVAGARIRLAGANRAPS